jgi:hypothetical protein
MRKVVLPAKPISGRDPIIDASVAYETTDADMTEGECPTSRAKETAWSACRSARSG